MNNLARLGRPLIEGLRGSLEECVKRGLMNAFEAPVEHYLADGLYGRRVYGIPPRTTIVTKVHLSQHITIALKGTCTVFGQDGQKKIVKAGEVFVTEPGTQRAIYCHDDVEWLTVHACEQKEIKKIEHQLFCDNLTEYDDRSDYVLFLNEIGLNEDLARLISENKDDQTSTHDTDNIYLSDSELQGTGIFANKCFETNELIGIARINDLRTAIGRYANHSKNPNCKFEICDNLAQAIALRYINKDEEITVDYRNAIAIANKMRMLT